MQIQKVNSNQNFEGGLVKISPTQFIDVDIIEGLRYYDTDMWLDLIGKNDGIKLRTFGVGEQAGEIFKSACQKFKDAKRWLGGSNNETFMIEGNQIVSADAIKGLRVIDNFVRFDFADHSSPIPYKDSQAARNHLLEIAQELHLRKAPNGGAIVDLLG